MERSWRVSDPTNATAAG